MRRACRPRVGDNDAHVATATSAGRRYVIGAPYGGSSDSCMAVVVPAWATGHCRRLAQTDTVYSPPTGHSHLQWRDVKDPEASSMRGRHDLSIAW